jgi:hypothetical protein
LLGHAEDGEPPAKSQAMRRILRACLASLLRSPDLLFLLLWAASILAGTVYAGFRMVDLCSEIGVEAPAPQQAEAMPPRAVPLSTRMAVAFGVAAGGLAMVLAAYGESMRTALGDRVRAGYYAPPGSTAGRWIASLACSRALFSVEY